MATQDRTVNVPAVFVLSRSWDEKYYLLDDEEFTEERKTVLKGLKCGAVPCAATEDLVFSQGHWIFGRDVFDILLKFLREADLCCEQLHLAALANSHQLLGVVRLYLLEETFAPSERLFDLL